MPDLPFEAHLSDHHVQKENVDNLRQSDAVTLGILVADLLRLHIERIEISCVADMFALAEADLPASITAELRNWATRAARDVVDLPEGEARAIFLSEVAELPPAKVSKGFREAVQGMAVHGSPGTIAALDELAKAWDAAAPEVITIPKKAGKVVAAAQAKAAKDPLAKKVVGAPKKRVGAAKTPAADVDPRRALYIRDEAVATLSPYERGVKESILVAGIRSRAPYPDVNEAEVRTELRKLERERKLKKTAERWMIR